MLHVELVVLTDIASAVYQYECRIICLVKKSVKSAETSPPPSMYVDVKRPPLWNILWNIRTGIHHDVERHVPNSNKAKTLAWRSGHLPQILPFINSERRSSKGRKERISKINVHLYQGCCLLVVVAALVAIASVAPAM
jgi:hypothetical protein